MKKYYFIVDSSRAITKYILTTLNPNSICLPENTYYWEYTSLKALLTSANMFVSMDKGPRTIAMMDHVRREFPRSHVPL